MNQAITDCVKFVFENELSPLIAPVTGRQGRAPLRMALGELMNWLKGIAEGFAGPRLHVGSPTLRRVLRAAVTEIEGLADLFEVKHAHVAFRQTVGATERNEIAAYVRANSRFPEDVLIRPAK
jgi:hypothetical protein